MVVKKISEDMKPFYAENGVLDVPNVELTGLSLKEHLVAGNMPLRSSLTVNQKDAADVLVMGLKAETFRGKDGRVRVRNYKFSSWFHALTFGFFMPK